MKATTSSIETFAYLFKFFAISGIIYYSDFNDLSNPLLSIFVCILFWIIGYALSKTEQKIENKRDYKIKHYDHIVLFILGLLFVLGLLLSSSDEKTAKYPLIYSIYFFYASHSKILIYHKKFGIEYKTSFRVVNSIYEILAYSFKSASILCGILYAKTLFGAFSHGELIENAYLIFCIIFWVIGYLLYNIELSRELKREYEINNHYNHDVLKACGFALPFLSLQNPLVGGETEFTISNFISKLLLFSIVGIYLYIAGLKRQDINNDIRKRFEHHVDNN